MTIKEDIQKVVEAHAAELSPERREALCEDFWAILVRNYPYRGDE